MRSYFFSADTQEDMLGWVRALSQSAAMEADGSLNRCSSVHHPQHTKHFSCLYSTFFSFSAALSGVAQVIRISPRSAAAVNPWTYLGPPLMERVHPKSTGISAGLWVNRVNSPVGGWGRRTQSTEGGGACIRETAGCQVISLSERHILKSLRFIWRKKWTERGPSFGLLLCLLFTQNAQPFWFQQKSLWAKPGGRFSPRPEHPPHTSRNDGNRFFDVERSAGITTSHAGRKGRHPTPRRLGLGAADAVLHTCLAQAGVQIHPYHTGDREVAEPQQGLDGLLCVDQEINPNKPSSQISLIHLCNLMNSHVFSCSLLVFSQHQHMVPFIISQMAEDL